VLFFAAPNPGFDSRVFPTGRKAHKKVMVI
jgi:hypothetical protein